MEKVRINRVDLMHVMRKNRDEHREIFEEALIGYKAKCIEELDMLLKRARAGERVQVYVAVQQPMDQTADYDRVIRMLEMSIDEVVELTQQQFACYVMDDWGWKGDFIGTNALYSAKARSSLR